VDNNNYYTRRSFANAVLRGRGRRGSARAGRGGRRERGRSVDKVGAGNGRSLACPVMRGSGKRMRGKTKGRREVILKWDRYASPSRASPRALCLRLPRSPRLPSPLVYPSYIYSAARFIPRT
jgi:hypothetical protein